MPRHRLRIPQANATTAEERPMVWSDDDPRQALQVGDVVSAGGIRYVVTAFEVRAVNGGLRTASYLVARE